MATMKPAVRACTDTIKAKGGRYDYQPETPCPYDAKRDGLCSSHLAARTRRENADTAAAEDRARRRAQDAKQEAQIEALNELGVDASPVIGARNFQTTGLYVADIDHLIALLKGAKK